MLIYDARHVINTSNIITGYWNKIFEKNYLNINIQFADICCCVILIFSLHIS